MWKRMLKGAAVGAGAALICLLLWAIGVFDVWETASWRWRVEAFAKPGAATGKIKLILLDQASLDWGSKENGWSWPWPREVYSAVIDFCTRSGAKAVLFDVLYTEPSLYGVTDDRTLGEAAGRAR